MRTCIFFGMDQPARKLVKVEGSSYLYRHSSCSAHLRPVSETYRALDIMAVVDGLFYLVFFPSS